MAATALVLIALGGATHNRERGIVTNVAWSRDGASIFYDRMADAPRGIYSVPLLVGDEHLVLESAIDPRSPTVPCWLSSSTASASCNCSGSGLIVGACRPPLDR